MTHTCYLAGLVHFLLCHDDKRDPVMVMSTWLSWHINMTMFMLRVFLDNWQLTIILIHFALVFFPWNLVCAISVPNGVASGIKSSKLCLQFFLNVKFKAKDSKTKNHQDPNCWPVWVPSVWPPPSHPLWCRWSPRLLWADRNVTLNKNLTDKTRVLLCKRLFGSGQDLIIRAQSTAIFLCIQPFSAWWRTITTG